MAGCCGCSLHASVVTAAVLSVIDAIICMIDASLIIVLIQHPNVTSTLGSSEFKEALDSFSDFGNGRGDILLGLLIGMLVLAACLFLSAFLMCYGNSARKHGYLLPWMWVAILTLLYSVGTTIYIATVLSKDWEYAINKMNTEKNMTMEETSRLILKNFPSIVLMSFFSRGGIIWWGVAAALICYVGYRYKEIKTESKAAKKDQEFLKHYDQRTHPTMERPTLSQVNNPAVYHIGNTGRNEGGQGMVKLPYPPPGYNGYGREMEEMELHPTRGPHPSGDNGGYDNPAHCSQYEGGRPMGRF